LAEELRLTCSRKRDPSPHLLVSFARCNSPLQIRPIFLCGIRSPCLLNHLPTDLQDLHPASAFPNFPMLCRRMAPTLLRVPHRPHPHVRNGHRSMNHPIREFRVRLLPRVFKPGFYHDKTTFPQFTDTAGERIYIQRHTPQKEKCDT